MCEYVFEKGMSMDELYEQTKKLMSYFVGKFNWQNNPRFDIDDLRQEAWIAIQTAYDRWDPEKGPFKSYVYPYIDGYIKLFIDRNYSSISNSSSRLSVDEKGGRSIEVPVSFDNKIPGDKDDATYAEVVGGPEEGYDMVELLETVKTFADNKKHYDLWYKRYVIGYAVKELAEEYGCSRQTIFKHLNKINKKLENYINERG